MKIRMFACALSIGSIALVGCGSSTSTSTTATTLPAAAAASVAPAGAAFNDADVTFARGMIPHHEQAIEMADIALDPTVGASDAVRGLATRIKAAQDPEVALMKGWLTAWGQPLTTDMTSSEMAAMEGMMSVSDMDALGKLKAVEFDTKWLEMMVSHHNGAIKMAQTVKATGKNADVLTLAGNVISAQQAEIDEMATLIGA